MWCQPHAVLGYRWGIRWEGQVMEQVGGASDGMGRGKFAGGVESALTSRGSVCCAVVCCYCCV